MRHPAAPRRSTHLQQHRELRLDRGGDLCVSPSQASHRLHFSFSTGVTFISWSGACLTQSSGREITADEFLAMVQKCGLNLLLQYAPWLAKLLAAARQRPEVLEALRGLQQIAYTGASMNPEDEQWALQEGIKLTVGIRPASTTLTFA